MTTPPIRSTSLLIPCACLGFTAGFVDTTGFIELFHLFTAHVTGNLILLGAGIAQNSYSGALVRLAVIPLFAVGVLIAALAARHAPASPVSRLRALLLVEAAVLAVFLFAGIWLGDGLKQPASDSRVITIAAAAVLAMGVQSAIPRVSRVALPMSNVMTGNVTELTLAMASILGPGAGSNRDEPHPSENPRGRAGVAATLVASFIVGAAGAAVLLPMFGFSAAVAPVFAISAAAICVRDHSPQ